MRELMDLTGRWWDWRVDLWDSSTLRLIADNDLTYHHLVEVSFIDVVWAATAVAFYHPTFRPATATERNFAREVIDEPGYTAYPWDAETSTATAPMMIIAQSVRIVEGSFVTRTEQDMARAHRGMSVQHGRIDAHACDRFSGCTLW